MSILEIPGYLFLFYVPGLYETFKFDSESGIGIPAKFLRSEIKFCKNFIFIRFWNPEKMILEAIVSDFKDYGIRHSPLWIDHSWSFASPIILFIIICRVFYIFYQNPDFMLHFLMFQITSKMYNENYDLPSTLAPSSYYQIKAVSIFKKLIY